MFRTALGLPSLFGWIGNAKGRFVRPFFFCASKFLA